MAEETPEKPKQTRRNIQRAWRSSELKLLREDARLGARAIAEKLGRTERSVRMAAHRLRISLRTYSQRHGLILGQSRDESWSKDPIRSKVLAGEIDISLAEQRILDDVRRPAPLCPACMKRPQRHETTGLCGVCHRHALEQQLEEQAAEREARRSYEATKQRTHRASSTCIEDGCEHEANGIAGRCFSCTTKHKKGLL